MMGSVILKVSLSDALQNSGGRNMPGFGGSTQTTDDEESTKGLKAGSLILIDEGGFEVSSKDDSFHSNGDIEINGGSFTDAANPELGERLYEQFLADCASLGYPPQHGRFGADMKVESVNDGPVTLILDTEQLMDTPRRK